MAPGDDGMERQNGRHPERRRLYAFTEPRQPRNLQDLVRYSIEAGPSRGQHAIADPERRRFLEEALQSLTQDVAKELAEAIETVKNYRSTDEDQTVYECALDIIADRVDGIDCANDFCKLGGFDIVSTCLSSNWNEIRWRICDIIAQCTQNNPFCQEHALKFEFIQPLLEMVDKDSNEKCKIKAFFAVSNIVRDYKLGLEEFLKHDGFSVVLRAMQSDIEKLRNKTTFFLSSILSQNHELIGEVFNMGFVEQLVSLIQRDHSPMHEHIIYTLLTIVKNYEPAINECRRSELYLLSTLRTLLQNYKHDDAFSEEMCYVKEIIELVFSNDSEEDR